MMRSLESFASLEFTGIFAVFMISRILKAYGISRISGTSMILRSSKNCKISKVTGSLKIFQFLEESSESQDHQDLQSSES